MLCQLSYRGRQRADCTGRRLRFSERQEQGVRPRTPLHASLRRRWRRAVHRRLRSDRGWHGGQPPHRRGPGGAQGARVRSGAGRRALRAVDAERARVVSAHEEGSPSTASSIARPGGRSEREAARCSDSVSLPSARSAGTSRCSSSGCGGTGFQGVPSTAASRARPHPRYGVISGGTGSLPTGSPGPNTYRALAKRAAARAHVVRPGESFFSIAAHYHVSPWLLARRNRLPLTSVIVPDQRLVLPRGARLSAPAVTGPPASRDAVRVEIDRWARVYGVDPQLARALAWMESGFQQDVVSSVGALGVMQLLPETWEFVDTVLLGVRTPRNYAGQRPRRGSLPALAARRVRREQAARAGGLVPGSAGGA